MKTRIVSFALLTTALGFAAGREAGADACTVPGNYQADFDRICRCPGVKDNCKKEQKVAGKVKAACARLAREVERDRSSDPARVAARGAAQASLAACADLMKSGSSNWAAAYGHYTTAKNVFEEKKRTKAEVAAEAVGSSGGVIDSGAGGGLCGPGAQPPSRLPPGADTAFFHALKSKGHYGPSRALASIDRVVLHNGGLTDGLADDKTIRNRLFLKWTKDKGTSSHFFVGQGGAIHYLTNIECVAHHGGRRYNARSIGIDFPRPPCKYRPAGSGGKSKKGLQSCGDEPNLCPGQYPKELIRGLKTLLNWIKTVAPNVKIDDTHIIGHREFEKKKSRVDPNCFPWNEIGLDPDKHPKGGLLGRAEPTAPPPPPGHPAPPQGQPSATPSSDTAEHSPEESTEEETPRADQPSGQTAVAGHISGSGVHVRKEPSTKARVVDTARRCEGVTILETGISGGGVMWTKVLIGGKEGYVASKYVAPGACEKKR